MLTVLGGMAEFERELIRARTGERRARAKARGQSLGRPFKLTPASAEGVDYTTLGLPADIQFLVVHIRLFAFLVPRNIMSLSEFGTSPARS
jgi:hypothetical protein